MNTPTFLVAMSYGRLNPQLLPQSGEGVCLSRICLIRHPEADVRASDNPVQFRSGDGGVRVFGMAGRRSFIIGALDDGP